MKKLKTTVLRTSVAALCALAVLSGPAQADDARDYKLGYEIYAGGAHALKADYSVAYAGDQMTVAIDSRTEGFIGTLFPWSGHYETAGRYEDDIFVASRHTSVSSWRDNPTHKEIVFKNGQAVKYTKSEKGETETKTEFAPEMVSDASDLLGAVMTVFAQIGRTDTCNTAAAAFDGKRKFKIQLTEPQRDRISPSGYSMFDGPALKCTLTVMPLEGFSERDMSKGWMAVQNHTAKRGKLPEIWFARLDQDGPMVPVRMEINSAYGGVIAHLTNMDTPALRNLSTAAGK